MRFHFFPLKYGGTPALPVNSAAMLCHLPLQCGKYPRPAPPSLIYARAPTNKILHLVAMSTNFNNICKYNTVCVSEKLFRNREQHVFPAVRILAT